MFFHRTTGRRGRSCLRNPSFDKGKHRLNYSASPHNPPPPRAVLFMPQSGVIPMLVSHGTSVEAQDADGLRPIHFAARKGRHIALLALLTAGADPWSVTSRRWNALHYSSASGSLWCTRLLAYWDSDSGVLARQENRAGTTAMDLGRCVNAKGFLSEARRRPFVVSDIGTLCVCIADHELPAADLIVCPWS